MRRRRPLCGCAGQGVTTDCAQSVQQGPRRRCWGADLSETGWLQGGGTLQLGEIMFVSSPLVGGGLLPDGPLDACGNGGQAKSVQALRFIILNSCYDFDVLTLAEFWKRWDL